ncbi:purine-binding chemotaxis protein CheW [Anaerosolibacter carboniphilus]|uniref:Purine-binding chemotaxis protein CheW n=1 Tax=Anaerosolibacter carboniphilus TaxID=1417629 RepID=A0A841L282_9FIRM|nr:chemotaxis protein CheW [Anaerosolibacter carboniphilus]MBB6216499.1 purine-binding chemotaxis protein CheW [Anaerosolibacter carboniphilus]
MDNKVVGTENQYVLFKLDDEFYGIDILQVETIERVMDITRVPHALDYVQGVINLRGEVVPVVNLRKRFCLPEMPFNDESRIIIVSVEEIVVGILVDSSSEVLQLNSDEIDDAANITNNTGNEFIKGIGKHEERIIILLDLKKVLDIREATDDAE